MPTFTDISSIPLDKFQMQKNPKPKQDPTNNQFFVYLDFPAQGYPVKFNPMLYNSAGKPHNVLNFAVTSSINSKPYPILYFASNGKFQMADLQSYIPVGIQITQKIHNTNIIGKSTSKDLQMIFECNQVGGSGNIFLHILLTKSTEKNGDDFNKIFENLTYIEQIETNTKNFETQNLKPAPFKYNFMSGISNQFGLDKTVPIKNSMKSFYFLDANKHKHFMLQTPIPISADNFTKIQDFYENVGLAQNPYTIYSTSTLIPDQEVPITNDVLVGPMDSLKDAQTTPPQTIDDYNNQQIKDKKDAKSKESVDKAEKANKEGFLGSFFEDKKEGLKTMNCRVANSSTKLVATLVGDERSMVSLLDGYTLIIVICIFVGVILLVGYIVKKYLLGGLVKKEKFVNLKQLYDAIRQRHKIIVFLTYFFLGLGLILSILMVILATNNIFSRSTSFGLIIIGILLVCISITIRMSIQLFNARSVPNRYPFTYSFIKNQLSDFLKPKAVIDLDTTFASNNKDTPSSTNNPEKIFIFLHQCISYYFGDRDWYSDKNDNTTGSKITSIEYPPGNTDENTIRVTFNNNPKIEYSNITDIKLETLAAASPNPK